MLLNRSKWRLASASPRSRRLARYNSTRFHTLVRSSAARYLLYRGFPRTTSIRAYVSRKKRDALPASTHMRSEEHTSELQSPDQLVCRLLLEKKNKIKTK